jgi:twitching motility protein PilT
MAEKTKTESGKQPAVSTGKAFDYKAVLQHMIQTNASDLHLKVGRPPTLRVDGQMVNIEAAPLKQEDLRSLAEQIMGPKNIKEFSELKESDFALAVPGVGRFRVNAYQQRGTIAYAFRTVPFQAKTISELNLPTVCERIAMMPRGLVLVTGITGSGKSTALASMLHYINQNRHANVITIEDPIEYLHRDINCSINQREVGTDTGSFGQALRRVLRQDPDIILVGEIRDLETLDTALKAAETGHLVFSTLHTTDATQTVNRILSFYPPHQQTEVRYMLSNALRAIVSLRLVKRADKKGRVPAAEVLVNSEAVRDQMRDLSNALNLPGCRASISPS